MEKKKLEAKEMKASIEKALRDGSKINEKHKDTLLETMARDKKEAEEEKRNKQCALYKIPPPSILRKSESKEKNISMAKTEIAETIKNNSKISRHEAMEILELMKDNQEEIQQPKTKDKENISKKERRIYGKMWKKEHQNSTYHVQQPVTQT